MKYKTIKSSDGTIKITFDGGYHAVIIPTKDEKNAVCVSCQIGCPVGCKFCFTGKIGFKRNLSAEEIIEQFSVAEEIIGKKPNTIIFMGMGEPSLNLDAVENAAEYFHRWLPYNHITISTSCVKNLDKLADMPYGIAVSLHSPFDSIRKKIMGSKVTVGEIVGFVDRCFAKRKKRAVLIEYVVIGGVNDRNKDLKKIIGLKWPKKVMFNLIELNPIGHFVSSGAGKFDEFKKGIVSSGWKCFTRRSRGKDIGAACGMLN